LSDQESVEDEYFSYNLSLRAILFYNEFVDSRSLFRQKCPARSSSKSDKYFGLQLRVSLFVRCIDVSKNS
jgi:hypothetical protein